MLCLFSYHVREAPCSGTLACYNNPLKDLLNQHILDTLQLCWILLKTELLVLRVIFGTLLSTIFYSDEERRYMQCYFFYLELITYIS
ncbi:hypothetical protein IEQ34_017238 [Dendrobium chrysotoxum]|uniref:Uncharacterized protein n=1 Tax=Dendrobium chrysotoxum TaxID=161865 RepID=A0AAV7GAZ3_DENCH|nr:hypothetical protein IEQ34_017238 [Dendrobium chrysotoxum]